MSNHDNSTIQTVIKSSDVDGQRLVSQDGTIPNRERTTTSISKTKQEVQAEMYTLRLPTHSEKLTLLAKAEAELRELEDRKAVLCQWIEKTKAELLAEAARIAKARPPPLPMVCLTNAGARKKGDEEKVRVLGGKGSYREMIAKLEEVGRKVHLENGIFGVEEVLGCGKRKEVEDEPEKEAEGWVSCMEEKKMAVKKSEQR